MDRRRLKILLIAANCDSDGVGEGFSTFQWVSRIGSRHDVTLLTSRKGSQATSASQLPGVRVIEWPDFRFFDRWERFNSMLKPGYVGLYIRARRWLKQHLKSGERFDLVHQISPLALRYPSPGTGLGIPLVIGPLGGSVKNPEGFRAELKAVAWYTKLRCVDEWRLRRDPWLRNSYSNASSILCVAPYVKKLLGDLVRENVVLMSETGVSQLPPYKMTKRNSGPPRLLFVGRVIRSKGVRDAIRAMAKLGEFADLKLDVVGEGDDLHACKREAHELGVSGRVTFHGKLPRKEVDTFYERADIFVFPSFREPSGNVVLEAMSYGLAMVVADLGGPGFVVDDACGFRVPVVDPVQYASGIAACIRELIMQPELAAAMGNAARDKIGKDYLWDVKVDRLMELYDNVLANSRSSRP